MEWMFTKRLTRTDARVRLSWPMDQLRELTLLRHANINLNHSPGDGNDTNDSSRLEFQVYDMESQCYRTLTCTTRRSGGHPKPVITGGWTRFITDNGLQEGDEIIFYKNTDHAFVEAPFSVQVARNGH